MTVKAEHVQYAANALRWKRMRDTTAGQDAVHMGGELYLPKLKDQSTEEYKAYVLRAGFYNATWRTVAGLVGMLFRKDPKFTKPDALDTYLDDVDLKGSPFDIFIKDTTTEVLTMGRVGLLVDVPPGIIVPGGQATKAQVEAANIRPFLAMYKTETIINWKQARINNKWITSQVVLKECKEVPKDEFESTYKDQYRVLDIDPLTLAYRIRVFEIDGTTQKEVLVEGPLYPLMNGKPLDFIPFWFLSIDGTTVEVEEPPLVDLADVNLDHYRVNADYRHGLHFVGLPTPVISGYQPGVDASGAVVTANFYIGSSKAWTFPDPQAKATFLEFTGQGLKAMTDALDRMEQQMAVLGARMLAAEKKQAETATTAAIHRTGENSILASAAISISLAMTRALQVFADWAGVTSDEVELDINRDFMPVPMDAPTLTALVSSWQAGAISSEEFFTLLQRGDVIDGAITFEEHQAQIEAQPPPLPVGMPDPNAPELDDNGDPVKDKPPGDKPPPPKK